MSFLLFLILDTSSLNKLLNPIKDYRPMKNLTIFPDVVKEALFQSKTSLEKEKGGGSKPAQPDIKEDKPKSALDLKIIPVALKLPKKKLSKPTQPPQPAAIVLDISKINTESKNENSKQKNDVITSQSLDEKLAEEIMNQDAIKFSIGMKAYDVLLEMEDRKRPISVAPIINSELKLVGIVSLHDLIQKGLK